MAFIIAAVYIVRSATVREFFTRETLGNFLDAAGFWAPLAFILVYTVGICFFVPGTLLTALGAAFSVRTGDSCMSGWGRWQGRGCLLDRATSGRDFAASLIGDQLRKYDDAIEINGFATVLYLRLVYFPFTAMNFGMGLTKVRFWDYFWGTALGILVGTFIFTFFVGSLKEVWATWATGK